MAFCSEARMRHNYAVEIGQCSKSKVFRIDYTFAIAWVNVAAKTKSVDVKANAIVMLKLLF
jgi:hypothetical protein